MVVHLDALRDLVLLNKPSGKRLLLPIGGGLQYNFRIWKQDLTFSGQVFKYLERPPTYPDWNVRLVLEWVF